MTQSVTETNLENKPVCQAAAGHVRILPIRLLPASAAAGFCLTAALLWARALKAGFWLDECVTFWVAAEGPGRIFERSVLSLQSPMHALLAWVGMKVTGSAELGMRLPSLFAIIVAAALLYRLAARVGGSEFAAFGTAFLLSSPFVTFFAVDARPYACAIACSIGALEALFNWKTGGRWRHALLFAVLSSLTVHFQLLFIYFYAVFGMAWLILPPKACPLRKRQMLVVAFTIALLLSPLVYHFQTMLADRAVKSSGFPPTGAAVLDYLVPPLTRFSLQWALAAGCLVAIVAAALGKAVGWRKVPISRPWVIVMAVAAVLPVSILLAVAALTGVQVFTARYAILSAAPLALLFACAFRRLPAACAYPAMGVFVAIQLFGLSQSPYETLHGNEGWREASQFIETLPGTGPILVRAGLAEGVSLRYLTSERFATYLRVPLVAYPNRSKKTILLPYVDSPELRGYLRDVYTEAARRQSFLLLTTPRCTPGQIASGDTLRAIAAWANQDGFTVRQIAGFGWVSVWEFRKSELGPAPLYPGSSPALFPRPEIRELPIFTE